MNNLYVAKNLFKIDELKKAEAIYNVTRVAKDNHVFADFIEYMPDHPEYKDSGVYFVCCPELDHLLSLKRNMSQFHELLEADRHKGVDEINCYYNIVDMSYLTDENYFYLHNKMCRSIHETSLLKTCFGEYGYPLPKSVVRTTIDNLYTFNEKRNNRQYPEALRQRYEEVMKKYVADSYHTYSELDPKPDVKSIPLSKNQVSSDYFIKNHIKATYETVNPEFFDFIKSKLPEHPEFIFYKESKPFMHLKDASKWKGISELNFWKDIKEVKEYNIGFPTSQENIFYGWMIDYNCRNYQGRVPYQNIAGSTSEVKYLYVDIDDAWNWNSLCMANGVRYAINSGQFKEISQDDVRNPLVAYRVEDQNKVNSIIDRLAGEKRGYLPVNSVHIDKMYENKPRIRTNPYIHDQFFDR